MKKVKKLQLATAYGKMLDSKTAKEFSKIVDDTIKVCTMDVPMIMVYFGSNCIVALVCYMANIDYIEEAFSIKLTLLKEHKKGGLYDVYQIHKDITRR